MITVEIDDGMAVLRGRNPDTEWLIVPYWPCSGRTVRKMAPDKLPREFVDEAARFADAEIASLKPIAWRYQRKEGWEDVWRYSTSPITDQDFETPSDWTVEPLYLLTTP